MKNQNLASTKVWMRSLHFIGAPLHEHLATWKDACVLLFQVIQRIPQIHCWRLNEISHSVVQTGLGSLPIVILSTTVAGVILTNEIAWHMNAALHTVTMIPGFAGQFIFRELGIAIPALLMVAKVGAATTAEIATMKVTEQIDALKLLGIDPIHYLVFPRFIAAILSGACLSVISVSITLACSILISVMNYHFSVMEFFNALRHFIGVKDMICALVKGTTYGAVIPIISCTYGFRCQGGAEGVGTATTNSVVSATIVVIFLDFFLTYLFTLVL